MSATAVRVRVLLLVRHRGNHDRLCTWFEETLGAELVAEPGDTADLIVADAAAFVAERPLVDRMRSEALPLFVPCLLVCTPREAARVTSDVWRSADDVVVTPIRPGELQVRVERLAEQRARTVAAEAARVELERSNVDLERFAFVAAHELVAPLSIVSGAVQTVAARFVDGDAAAGEILDAAVEGCHRMQALIDNILNLSRAGRATAAQPVEMDALVRDVCDELRPRLAAAGAAVSYTELPTVLGDPAQLRLIFRNLIGNAVKFRRPDVTPEVEVTAEQEGDSWRFCLTDNGIGITAADKERVFELFARSDSRTAVPGTGIGLAICRRIVERLGGSIWVETHDGPGTRVCFTLPGALPPQ